MAKLDWTKTKDYRKLLQTPANIVVGSVTKSKINFGKYKGQYIQDVPTDYLLWAAETMPHKRQRHAWIAELERRAEGTNTSVELVESQKRKTPAYLLQPTKSKLPTKPEFVVTQPRDQTRRQRNKSRK